MFDSNTLFSEYLISLNIFNSVNVNNMCFYSNIAGYFEYGINSDLSNTSNNAHTNMINYYYKTNKVSIDNNFFIYHGNYLPELETLTSSNYMFLPSANLFEVEDRYINIFGDLQKGNQVIDFADKEEIKSDFYILKNMFSSFYFFSNKCNNLNSFYALDSIFNELVFSYFNYFVLYFDLFPVNNNYNINSCVYNKLINSHYFNNRVSNLTVQNSFSVVYSSTLRTFYKSRNSKQLSSFL